MSQRSRHVGTPAISKLFVNPIYQTAVRNSQRFKSGILDESGDGLAKRVKHKDHSTTKKDTGKST